MTEEWAGFEEEGEAEPFLESWTVLGVPRSHWHCQLSNFVWDAVRPTTLRETVETFLDEVVDGGSPHLFLTGEPGSGKSHLSVGSYRSIVARLGPALARFVHVPAFCDKVKNAYGDREGNPLDDYRSPYRLVVLDDLFARNYSDHEGNVILYQMIDYAYLNDAAMIVTMNPRVEKLGTRFHPHEVSRLLANGTVVEVLADDDWRLG